MTRMFRYALGVLACLAAAPLSADPTSPPGGQVTTVSVISTPGFAELVIAVEGEVEVRDFVLREPDRLVLDLTGATLRRTGQAYDGVVRAGIRDVRYSQFRSDVVRIAITLDGPRDYTIEQAGGAVRVRFGTDRSFLAWSSATPAELTPPPSARTPEVVLPASQPAAAPQVQAPRITVTWDRATIGDVIAGFASFSGRTIVLGKDVKGEVTAEIKNQPWTEAFAAVLAAQGLQAIELPGGIIRVDSPAALAALDSLEPLTTRMVPINYAAASQLLPSVKSVLSKRGNVVADTTTNSLIITETRSKVGEVQDFVRNLDVRTPQISIQSKIIFVDRTNTEALGVKYDFGSDDGPFFNQLRQRIDPNTGDPFEPGVISFAGEGIAAMANAEGLIQSPALSLIWATTIGGFKFTSFVDALQSLELADVQAEPSITTVDNREALIRVGEDVPVRVVDFGSAGGQGGGSQAQASVQFKETGIQLKVTPHVTNNRQILMQIEAERSDIRLLSAVDLGFTVRKQNAKNQLLVADGETAVIGGLTVTEVTKTRSGVPLLSQLPLVGGLFGFSNTSEARRDLIILVTPRIIDAGGE
jgi:type IV pilus assembly protein PilQ